jgi:hypothetical protein
VAISVLVYRPLPGNGYELLAEAAVDRGKLTVEGPRADLVDESRKVYSTRLRRFVTPKKDVEEWLRSFADSFKTAQVGAVITRDSKHRELVAPEEVVAEIREASHHGFAGRVR